MPDGIALHEPTYRLIPSQFPPIAAFDDVSSPNDLQAVIELEGWTNDRLVAARLKRLPRSQWVYGRPNASIVMAAFLHGAPNGSRFTGPELDAWYASLAKRTAIAEVAHHLRRQTINEGQSTGRMSFRSYGARLEGDGYIDVRGRNSGRPDLYDRQSYDRSQVFGEQKRSAGQDGIIYDSLRHSHGVNVVCFVPTRIVDVLQQDHFEIQVYADHERKPDSDRRIADH